MSGHSKWSTIKHKKAATDKKRSKAWSKLSRGVTMAARSGGDPRDNPRLRLAVDKAKAANMPKDTIEKAIKKGCGESEGESLQEVTYEGYGPGGVAVLAQAITDNRNRTGPEIKKVFERAGGNLGAPNSVAWMFTSKGVLTIAKEAVEEEQVMEVALDNGADDVISDGDFFSVTCPPEKFEGLRTAMQAADIPLEAADVTMVAANTVSPDLEQARKVLKLMDALDDHDDVTTVSTNCDLPDELIAEMS